MPFEIQNSKLWEGARANLDIAPGPKETPVLNFESLSPVYDVGQAGFVNPNIWMGSYSASIDGVALSLNFDTVTWTQDFGTIAPTSAYVRRIQSIVILLGGGTVTPINYNMSLVDPAGSPYFIEASSMANPSNAKLNVSGTLVPAGVNIIIGTSIGGAGDNVVVNVLCTVGELGQELPL